MEVVRHVNKYSSNLTLQQNKTDSSMKLESHRLYKKYNMITTTETEKQQIFNWLEEKPTKFITKLLTKLFKNGYEKHNISKVYWKQHKSKQKLTYNFIAIKEEINFYFSIFH